MLRGILRGRPPIFPRGVALPASADGPGWTGGRCWGTMLPPCLRQPPRAKAEQAFPPPPQSRISVLCTGAAGLARMDLAPGLGITARSPPTYIFRLAGRQARRGMAVAGGAASRRGPGRPCTFSIEHILSSLPERSPSARAARPPQSSRHQSPAEPGEPGESGAPEIVSCSCCCCCGPRAASRGTPEEAAGLGEWARGARARRGTSGHRVMGGEFGSCPAFHSALALQARCCRGH